MKFAAEFFNTTINHDGRVPNAAFHIQVEDATTKKHSRYMNAFYNNLPIIEQRLRSRRIPHDVLQNPNESSWKTLLHSGNNYSHQI